MRRIVVYGVTGSGKSTLAARIGARLGLPYHSVDDLTWEPGWVEAVYPNLTYFNEVDSGGHFAAWEEPELFAEEVRAGFRKLR